MTDKERLKNIKEQYQWAVENRLANRVDDSDIEWLIEQVKDLKIMLKILGEENQRYKHALWFYADEEHYKEKLISGAQYDADGICISNDKYLPPIIYLDKGEIARKALEENYD